MVNVKDIQTASSAYPSKKDLTDTLNIESTLDGLITDRANSGNKFVLYVLAGVSTNTWQTVVQKYQKAGFQAKMYDPDTIFIEWS